MTVQSSTWQVRPRPTQKSELLASTRQTLDEGTRRRSPVQEVSAAPGAPSRRPQVALADPRSPVGGVREAALSTHSRGRPVESALGPPRRIRLFSSAAAGRHDGRTRVARSGSAGPAAAIGWRRRGARSGDWLDGLGLFGGRQEGDLLAALFVIDRDPDAASIRSSSLSTPRMARKPSIWSRAIFRLGLPARKRNRAEWPGWRILLVGPIDSTLDSPNAHRRSLSIHVGRVAPGAKPSARQKTRGRPEAGSIRFRRGSTSAVPAGGLAARAQAAAGLVAGAWRRGRGQCGAATSSRWARRAGSGGDLRHRGLPCGGRFRLVTRPARSCGRSRAGTRARVPPVAGEGHGQSSGTTSASMTSSDSHDPWLGRARRPGDRASVIRPAASRRATRSLFERAQVLLGLRGRNHCIDRWSSTRPSAPSIQPKQGASSTASSYDTVGLPARFFHVTSHTPSPGRWFSCSQARQAALDSGWTRGSSAMAPVSAAAGARVAARETHRRGEDAPAHRQTDAPPANLSA